MNQRCSGRTFATRGDLLGYPCDTRPSVQEPDGRWFCAKCAPSKRREKEDYRRRPQWAMEACRELIKGEGTAESTQRAIDLARIAIGIDPMPEIGQPHSFKLVKK